MLKCLLPLYVIFFHLWLLHVVLGSRLRKDEAVGVALEKGLLKEP